MWWGLTAIFLLNLSPDPFTYASQATQVPVRLLIAVSRVESNHHPWALNIKGKVMYPKSREEAEKILRQSPDTVDIGHMQVNYQIWGKRLGLTKNQLLDPYFNSWAGAVILRYYLSHYPFWEAIGRYHSPNRDRQLQYTWRIYKAF
jgi:hypothetical protein